MELHVHVTSSLRVSRMVRAWLLARLAGWLKLTPNRTACSLLTWDISGDEYSAALSGCTTPLPGTE